MVQVEGAGHLPMQHRPVDLNNPKMCTNLQQHTPVVHSDSGNSAMVRKTWL